MNTALLLSAWVVGFLGSFHCIGMCGPIAIMLSGNQSNTKNFMAGRLMYNFGRVITYSIFGIAAGFTGSLFSINGLQSELSIAAGVLIILSVLFLNEKRMFRFFPEVLAAWNTALKKRFSSLIGRKTLSSLLLIGMINGLLPCGFVYLALAGAVAAGSVANGAAYMVFFGLGTIPAMLAVSLAGHLFGMRFRNLFRRATPFLAIAVSVLLIYRGIILHENKTACCHHPEKAVMK
jgi:sulfite exporter TauE/SafE